MLPTLRNHVQKYYDKEKMQEVYQILRDFNEGRLNKNQAEFLLKTFFELKKDDIHHILDISKIGVRLHQRWLAIRKLLKTFFRLHDNEICVITKLVTL